MDTGSLLQLMHDAVAGWETFQAECREWRHTQRSYEAFLRMYQGRGEMHGLRGPSETDAPEVVEEVVRLWVAGMHRIRQETILPNGRTGAIVVVDGDQWWFFNPRQGVLRHDGGDHHSVGTFDVASLLDPSVVIPDLQFGSIRAGDVDGRASWVVDATPREKMHDERHPGSSLPGGADHYRLWIDQDRGVALRIEASWQGEPFSIRDATRVVFDAALPDELFAYRPPAGVPVYTTQDELDVRDVSIDEVARLAPFTVLIPFRLPAGMTLEVVRYAPGSGFSGAKPTVMLLARDELGQGGYVSIEETASSDAQADGLDWQATQHRGATYMTCDDHRKPKVRIDLHGTSVQLSGPLDLAALLDIAESLEPAATTATDSDDTPR